MSYLDKKLTEMFNNINSSQDVFYAVKKVKTENIEKHIKTTHTMFFKYNKLPNITDIRECGNIEDLTKSAFTLGDIYEGLYITLRYRFINNEATRQAQELSKEHYIRASILSTIRHIIREQYSNEKLQSFVREQIRETEYQMILHRRNESSVRSINNELKHIKGVMEILNDELTDDTKEYYITITNKVKEYLKQVA